MRDLLSKIMTGAMIAGAALLVAACDGKDQADAGNITVVRNDTTAIPPDANETDVTDDGQPINSDPAYDDDKPK